MKAITRTTIPAVAAALLLLWSVPAALAECGPGPVVTSNDQSIALQSLGATTNAFFLPTQTLAITSGTSGCSNDGLIYKDKEQAVYVAYNYEGIVEDLAAGQGEHLSALAGLMGCDRSATDALGTVAQERFEAVVPERGRAPDALLAALKREAAAHPRVASGCATLS